MMRVYDYTCIIICIYHYVYIYAYLWDLHINTQSHQMD